METNHCQLKPTPLHRSALYCVHFPNMNIPSIPGHLLKLLFLCGLADIPGPPSITISDFYFQLLPINRLVCSPINTEMDLFFKVYTRKNREVPTILKKDDDVLLRKSGIDFSKPTVMYFHGYNERSSESTELRFKEAYLDYGDLNIVNVEMKRLFAGPYFLTATFNSFVVGKYTAEMICYLKSKGLDLKNLHLIGISLGAQVIGIAAENLKCGRLNRVTALEPGGVLFKHFPERYRLDKKDAEFVVAIHTTIYIGFPRPVGHVDFWVNDPSLIQPGCISESIKMNFPSIPAIILCSHLRSLKLYIESISRKSLSAVECGNWFEYKLGKCTNNRKVYISPDLNETIRGNFFLDTNAVAPYGRD